ncbi:MAG: hypothetical protein J6Q84_03305 [Kiritimatiellae bacterium]|nr:hypothetical protein [Kiritimatiellia bacterium]
MRDFSEINFKPGTEVPVSGPSFRSEDFIDQNNQTNKPIEQFQKHDIVSELGEAAKMAAAGAAAGAYYSGRGIASAGIQAGTGVIKAIDKLVYDGGAFISDIMLNPESAKWFREKSREVDESAEAIKEWNLENILGEDFKGEDGDYSTARMFLGAAEELGSLYSLGKLSAAASMATKTGGAGPLAAIMGVEAYEESKSAAEAQGKELDARQEMGAAINGAAAIATAGLFGKISGLVGKEKAKRVIDISYKNFLKTASLDVFEGGLIGAGTAVAGEVADDVANGIDSESDSMAERAKRVLMSAAAGGALVGATKVVSALGAWVKEQRQNLANAAVLQGEKALSLNRKGLPIPEKGLGVEDVRAVTVNGEVIFNNNTVYQPAKPERRISMPQGGYRIVPAEPAKIIVESDGTILNVNGEVIGVKAGPMRRVVNSSEVNTPGEFVYRSTDPEAAQKWRVIDRNTGEVVDSSVYKDAPVPESIRQWMAAPGNAKPQLDADGQAFMKLYLQAHAENAEVSKAALLAMERVKLGKLKVTEAADLVDDAVAATLGEKFTFRANSPKAANPTGEANVKTPNATAARPATALIPSNLAPLGVVKPVLRANGSENLTTVRAAERLVDWVNDGTIKPTEVDITEIQSGTGENPAGPLIVREDNSGVKTVISGTVPKGAATVEAVVVSESDGWGVDEAKTISDVVKLQNPDITVPQAVEAVSRLSVGNQEISDVIGGKPSAAVQAAERIVDNAAPSVRNRVTGENAENVTQLADTVNVKSVGEGWQDKQSALFDTMPADATPLEVTVAGRVTLADNTIKPEEAWEIAAWTVANSHVPGVIDNVNNPKALRELMANDSAGNIPVEQPDGSFKSVNEIEAKSLGGIEATLPPMPEVDHSLDLTPISDKPGAFTTARFPEVNVTIGQSDGAGKVWVVEGLTPQMMLEPRAREDMGRFLADIADKASAAGAQIDVGDPALVELAGELVANHYDTKRASAMKARQGSVQNLLSKSGLVNKVVSNVDEFNAKLESLPNGKAYRKDGKTWGFYDPNDGNVYLNGALFGTKTGLGVTIHEFAHPAVIATKKINRPLYDRGMELAAKVPLYSQLKSDPAYGKMSEETLREEVLVHILQGRLEDIKSQVPAKIYKEIEEFVNQFWRRFGEANGIRDLTPAMVATMTIEDVTDAIGAEMMSGKIFGSEGLDIQAGSVEAKVSRLAQYGTRMTKRARSAYKDVQKLWRNLTPEQKSAVASYGGDGALQTSKAKATKEWIDRLVAWDTWRENVSKRVARQVRKAPTQAQKDMARTSRDFYVANALTDPYSPYAYLIDQGKNGIIKIPEKGGFGVDWWNNHSDGMDKASRQKWKRLLGGSNYTAKTANDNDKLVERYLNWRLGRNPTNDEIMQAPSFDEFMDLVVLGEKEYQNWKADGKLTAAEREARDLELREEYEAQQRWEEEDRWVREEFERRGDFDTPTPEEMAEVPFSIGGKTVKDGEMRFSVAIPKGVKPSSNGRYNAGADNAGSVTDGHESRELTPKSAAPIRRFAQSISKSGTKSPRDFLSGIFAALGSKETNTDRSQYFSISRADRGSVSLRVANHRASAKTYLDNNNAADEKLSLVVKMSEKPFEPNGKVRLTEYVYFADKLTAEQETGIANAIANLIEGKNVVFPKAHQVNASPRVKNAAADEANIRFARGGTSPMGREVFVAGRARVAEDAERGERLPGVIAASAELSGQIHTPISQAAQMRTVSLPVSEIEWLRKQVTGNVIPTEIKRKLPNNGNAVRSREGKIVLAADVFGLVDKTDMAEVKTQLKANGYFRNEDPLWCSNATASDIALEETRSEDALADKLIELGDNRVAGREAGGVSAARGVFADQVAQVILDLPANAPGTTGAMRKLGDAFLRNVRGFDAEADIFLDWAYGPASAPRTPRERAGQMLGAFMVMPQEIRNRAPNYMTAIADMITNDPRLEHAWRQLSLRGLSNQAHAQVAQDIEKSFSRQHDEAVSKIVAEGNEPIKPGGLMDQAKENIIVGFSDTMGSVAVRIDARVKAYNKAKRIAIKQATNPADKARLEAELNRFMGAIGQMKNQIELSRTAYERGAWNEDLTYLYKMRDLEDVANLKWGLTESDKVMYLNLKRVIETEGRSGSRGVTPRQAQMQLDDMKARLGAVKWQSLENYGNQFHAIIDQDFLSDPRLERMFGKGWVDYCKSQVNYVTAKRTWSQEELDAIELAREDARRRGVAGGDDVVEQMYAYGQKAGAMTDKLVGSMADTADVRGATWEKHMAIKQAVRRNQLVLDLREALTTAGVEGVRDVRRGESAFPENKRYGHINYLLNGQKRTLIVPREIADGFKVNPQSANLLGTLATIARSGYIDWNPGFRLINNPIYDQSAYVWKMPGARAPIPQTALKWTVPGGEALFGIVSQWMSRKIPGFASLFGKDTIFRYFPEAKAVVEYLREPEKWMEKFMKAEQARDWKKMRKLQDVRDNALGALKANMFLPASSQFLAGKSEGFANDVMNAKGIKTTAQREEQELAKSKTRKVLEWVNIFKRNKAGIEADDMITKMAAYLHDRIAFGNVRTPQESGVLVKRNIATPDVVRRGKHTRGIQNWVFQFFNAAEKGLEGFYRSAKDNKKGFWSRFSNVYGARLVAALATGGVIWKAMLDDNDGDENKAKEKCGPLYDYAKWLYRASQNVSKYMKENYSFTPIWMSGDGLTTISLAGVVSMEDKLITPWADYVAQSFAAKYGLAEEPSAADAVAKSTIKSVVPDMALATPQWKIYNTAIASMWSNPHDAFTDRPYFDKDVWAARFDGGIGSQRFAAEVGMRLWNDLGGRALYGFDQATPADERNAAPEGVVDVLKKIPVLSPAIKRMIKVSVGSPEKRDAMIEEAYQKRLRTIRLCTKELLKAETNGEWLFNSDPKKYDAMKADMMKAYGLDEYAWSEIEAKYINTSNERAYWKDEDLKKYNQLRRKAEKLGMDPDTVDFMLGDE